MPVATERDAPTDVSLRARRVGAALLLAVWLMASIEAIRFAAAIFLLGFGAVELGRSRVLYSTAYHRVGDLSYGIYLYAFPIQMLTLSRWLTPGNVWLITGLDLAIVLACATLSWRFVERPTMRLKPTVERAPSVTLAAQ